MSLSRSTEEKPEVFKVPIATRAAYSLKKFNSAFFADPIKYVFYYTLVGIIFALFLGHGIRTELWLIFGVLCFGKAFKYISQSKEEFEENFKNEEDPEKLSTH